MSKSLQFFLIMLSLLKLKNSQTKSLQFFLVLLSSLKSENSQIKSQIIFVSNWLFLKLSSLQQFSQTQRDSMCLITDTSSSILSQSISSHEHEMKCSYWLIKNNSHFWSFIAAELYCVFLIINNIVIQNTWSVMISNLSNHDVDNLLLENNWFEWIYQLTNYCEFNSDI